MKNKKNNKNKSLIPKNKDKNIKNVNEDNIKNILHEVKDVKEEVDEVKGIIVEKSIIMIPFIPPNILAEYKKIDPSLVDFFEEQVTTQRKHRFNIDIDKAKTQNFIQKAGLWFGFLLGLISIVGSIILVAMGFDIQGLSILGTTFVSIIGISIYGIKKSQKKQDKLDTVKNLIKKSED